MPKAATISANVIEQIKIAIDEVKQDLYKNFDNEDVNIVVDIYKNALVSGSCDLSENFKPIADDLSEKLKDKKIQFSRAMSKKSEQKILQKRVKEIIAQTHELKSFNFKCEEDIKKQGECIQNLIKEGLWTMPGGAWCSANVPVFDKMSDCGSYPEFKHYKFDGEDVTEFANLDCQTPFYFVNFEDGSPNYDVIDFFIQNLVDFYALL